MEKPQELERSESAFLPLCLAKLSRMRANSGNLREENCSDLIDTGWLAASLACWLAGWRADSTSMLATNRRIPSIKSTYQAFVCLAFLVGFSWPLEGDVTFSMQWNATC